MRFVNRSIIISEQILTIKESSKCYLCVVVQSGFKFSIPPSGHPQSWVFALRITYKSILTASKSYNFVSTTEHTFTVSTYMMWDDVIYTIEIPIQTINQRQDGMVLYSFEHKSTSLFYLKILQSLNILSAVMVEDDVYCEMFLIIFVIRLSMWFLCYNSSFYINCFWVVKSNFLLSIYIY